MRAPRGQAGFTLVELLVALLLGSLLSGALVQALLVDSRASQRLAVLLRERQLGERALELMRQELRLARWVEERAALPAGCSLAGRPVVLQLGTSAGGVITYSVGEAPAPIWRGRVLMRCGPAYGLAGALSAGASQNRVLLDALVEQQGMRLERPAAGLLALRLERRVGPGLPLRQALHTEAPLLPAAP
jgi:prepilin-type N-terminal cleavage/methylation domain-containing protein